MELNCPEDGIIFCENILIPKIKEIVHGAIVAEFITHRENNSNHSTKVIIDEGDDDQTLLVEKIISYNLKEDLHKELEDSGFIIEDLVPEIKDDWNWIIDPIDGTNNFLAGLPYSVSVALSYKELDNVLLGVVYSPLDDTVYYASKDAGSFKLKNGSRSKLNVKSDMPSDMVIVGFPRDKLKTKKILSLINEEYQNSIDIKRIGPASMDICRVADRMAKKYIELDLKPWDISAGRLILEEAGGSFEQNDDLFIFK